MTCASHAGIPPPVHDDAFWWSNARMLLGCASVRESESILLVDCMDTYGRFHEGSYGALEEQVTSVNIPGRWGGTGCGQ